MLVRKIERGIGGLHVGRESITCIHKCNPHRRTQTQTQHTYTLVCNIWPVVALSWSLRCRSNLAAPSSPSTYTHTHTHIPTLSARIYIQKEIHTMSAREHSHTPSVLRRQVPSTASEPALERHGVQPRHSALALPALRVSPGCLNVYFLPFLRRHPLSSYFWRPMPLGTPGRI